MPLRATLVTTMLAALAAAPAHAGPPTEDLGPFAWDASARLRHEHVDDGGFARAAQATTLRLRGGVRWTPGPSLSAYLEGEAVLAAGDAYNSGANGRTAHPAVIDPESAEFNQAWLRWRGTGKEVTAGRQRVEFDNHRWIGNVGWRQNEQTFDAVQAQWQPAEALTLRYAWLDRVHRIGSDRALDPLARERDLDGHALAAAWSAGRHRVAGYLYAIDDRDLAAASTRTLGLRYALAPTADAHPFGATLEWARQGEHAANPRSFSHAYWLLEPAIATRFATLRAGWEHLGGDGTHALQTPLATLHAFNGWADRFTVTPAAGLDDRYVHATGRLARGRAQGPLDWAVAWHDYRADVGGARYGQEWNASLSVPFGPRWRALAKLADYRAYRFARDVTKAWLQLEWTPRAK